jgi:hypothetical protein
MSEGDAPAVGQRGRLLPRLSYADADGRTDSCALAPDAAHGRRDGQSGLRLGDRAVKETAAQRAYQLHAEAIRILYPKPHNRKVRRKMERELERLRERF